MVTDEQIIKAFESCEGEDGIAPKCSECPISHTEDVQCFTFVRKRLLEIVKRQKAENEELQTENKQLQSDVLIANQNYEHIKEIWEADKTRLSEKIKEYIDKHNELITKEAAIRAEAKKEFAEELIYKIVNTPTKFESTYYMYREGIAFRQNEIIDIIKEMAGADNAG